MTRDHAAAPLVRCLLVTAAAGAATTGLAATLVPDVLATATALAAGLEQPFEAVLVACCELALVLATAWGWVGTLLVAADAARGRSRGRRGVPRLLRRVVLLACGAALAGQLATPAMADAGQSRAHRGTQQEAPGLAGLPYPDRAPTGPRGPAPALGPAPPSSAARPAAAEQPHPQPASQTVTVTAGDTLWRLAAASLPTGSPVDDIARQATRLHRLNSAVIGPDPDLILPGQILRLPRRGEENP